MSHGESSGHPPRWPTLPADFGEFLPSSEPVLTGARSVYDSLDATLEELWHCPTYGLVRCPVQLSSRPCRQAIHCPSMCLKLRLKAALWARYKQPSWRSRGAPSARKPASTPQGDLALALGTDLDFTKLNDGGGKPLDLSCRALDLSAYRVADAIQSASRRSTRPDTLDDSMPDFGASHFRQHAMRRC